MLVAVFFAINFDNNHYVCNVIYTKSSGLMIIMELKDVFFFLLIKYIHMTWKLMIA